MDISACRSQPAFTTSSLSVAVRSSTPGTLAPCRAGLPSRHECWAAPCPPLTDAASAPEADGDPGPVEQAGRDRGAVPVGAHHPVDFIQREPAEAGGEIADEDPLAAGDPAPLPLQLLADVQHPGGLVLQERVAQLFHPAGRVGAQLAAARPPGVDTAGQPPLDVAPADADELGSRLFEPALDRVGQDQQQWVVERQHPAGVAGEPGVELDV